MRSLWKLILPFSILVTATAAHSDPWKDESGHGKKSDRREYKEEYWDGNCKVERKFEKNGEYKEKRKCKPVRHSQQQPVYVPPPVIAYPQPGITVHGTVNVGR